MPKFQSGFIKGLVLPLFENVDQVSHTAHDFASLIHPVKTCRVVALPLLNLCVQAVAELDLQQPVRLLHANVDRWQILMAKMNAVQKIHLSSANVAVVLVRCSGSKSMG